MTNRATVLREAGQGRNPAALSDVNCVLFFCALKKIVQVWRNRNEFVNKRENKRHLKYL